MRADHGGTEPVTVAVGRRQMPDKRVFKWSIDPVGGATFQVKVAGNSEITVCRSGIDPVANITARRDRYRMGEEGKARWRRRDNRGHYVFTSAGRARAGEILDAIEATTEGTT